MASFDVAYEWTMNNEDAQRQYKTVPDAPPGAFAISGINSAAFPSEFAAINACPQAQRGPLVKAFYQRHFWNQWFDQLALDDLAKRVFDAGINMGEGTAVKLLQEAADVAPDGLLGPATVRTANLSGEALIDAFIAQRVAHYKLIVLKNPADQKYLANWLARASK